ncbi:MAG: nucleotide exchange factor GrpE [Phycisphaerales bacterium]|nr:nucleotide exchange factor GrpE [Phycisphaerales bacterium]
MSRKKKHEEHDENVTAGVVDEESPNIEAPSDETPVEEDPLAKAQRDAEEWKDKYLRAKAEQSNALRRADNERTEAIRFANVKILRDLLEVADDFERAMEAARDAESVEGVIGGLGMVQDKLSKFLRDHDVETIEAQGAPFDPSEHEALLQQPSADHEPGTVIQQVQRGYKLRDRVLRPAKVIVASAPPDPAPEAEE